MRKLNWNRKLRDVLPKLIWLGVEKDIFGLLYDFRIKQINMQFPDFMICIIRSFEGNKNQKYKTKVQTEIKVFQEFKDE